MLSGQGTVGDFLRVIEQPGFEPERTMFFMPTAEGPCRFGQYAPLLTKVLREDGYGDVADPFADQQELLRRPG